MSKLKQSEEDNRESPEVENVSFNANINDTTIDDVDPECLVNLIPRLVRIQYPGQVQNVDKAISTLNGIHNIERVVCQRNAKLELNFHPKNKYNKSCIADKEYNPGILVKVTKKSKKVDVNKPSTSQNVENPEISYKIVGVTAMNFTFNRLCNFQYLPLVAEHIETKESKATYIYEDILPQFLPTQDYLRNEMSKTMPLYLTPFTYARFDSANNKLHLDAGEKFESSVRPDISKIFSSGFTKKKSDKERYVAKLFGKSRQLSVFWNGLDPIPEKVPDINIQIVKEKNLLTQYSHVKNYFDERPIWTKAAIQFISNLKREHCKFVLPAIGFFTIRGPWRSCWVRFGYNPLQEPKSRIYQTLDYRIRTGDGMKVKVHIKRKSKTKSTDYISPKVTLKNNTDASTVNTTIMDESSYLLKPSIIPPARQMFYQYCDLHLPEIENMIARLPQPSPETKCDPKNGWLPASFTEHCREIANKYVFSRVQKEIFEEKKRKDEEKLVSDTDSKEKLPSSVYCSQMLSNIRKGIYTSVPVNLNIPVLSPKNSQSSENIVIDNEGSGSDNDEQENDPEPFPDSDSEDDDSNELLIDLEALAEVNRLVGTSSNTVAVNTKESQDDSEEEVDELSKFLSKHL